MKAETIVQFLLMDATARQEDRLGRPDERRIERRREAAGWREGDQRREQEMRAEEWEKIWRRWAKKQ